jgi:hypothetical protein
MVPCLFASELHGQVNRYEALFGSILSDRPAGVFLSSDLLPSGLGALVDGDACVGDLEGRGIWPRL